MAFWVIGDIHGMHDPLKQLLIEIDKMNYFFDEDEKANKIIFLGDYIDYGPSSKAVIDTLINLDYETVFLAGNHEDHLLHFCNKTSFYEMYHNMWFKGNGGQDTVASFANSRKITEKVFKYVQFASYPGSKFTPDDYQFEEKYLNFFNKLVYAHKETVKDKYATVKLAFLHAGFDKDSGIEEQLVPRTFHEFHKFLDEKRIPVPFSSVGIRYEPEQKFADYILIHGHTPVYNMGGYKKIGNYDTKSGFPFLLFDKSDAVIKKERYDTYYAKNAGIENLISVNLDTAAVFGEYLTAMYINDSFAISHKMKFIQVHAGGQYRETENIRRFNIII